jgi:hypothetical protein
MTDRERGLRMRRLVKIEAKKRPHQPDFTHASVDDWVRLASSACDFCGSMSRVERDLRHVAVGTWNEPLAGENLRPACPLCWSTRNGMNPTQLRAHALRIQKWRTRRPEAFAIASPTTARVDKIYSRTKTREQKKCNRDLQLAKPLIAKMLSQNCWYCGSPPTGLDRLSSTVCPGYTMGNVVPCCTTCNSMKHVLPRGVFLRHMDHLATTKLSRR